MLFGKHINKYYYKYAFFFILGIAALVAVDFFQLDIPKIIGDIIDGLKDKTLTDEQLKDFILSMLFIAAVMFCGRFLWRYCIFGNGWRIESDLREEMFKHSEKLSQRFYQVNKVGSLMALYTNDLNAIRNVFGQGTVMLVDFVVLGSLTFYRMWMIDNTLTIIAMIPLILMAICSAIIGRYIRKKFEASQKAYADLSDFAQESFSGMAVIKAFVKEGKELLAFGKINKNSMDKNIEFVKASTLLRITIGLLISSVIIIIMGYGGWLVFNKSVVRGELFTIGTLTEYISYFTSLTWPMMAISSLINLRSQAKASLQRINQLLNEKIDIIDDDVIDVKDIKGKITYNNLNFSYPNSNREVLHNITFTINPGEKIGVVGRTGSGKTTLVDVLLRIYNLEANQVLIDDVDIMKLPIKKIRDAIAYVPQDNFLFSDTILNNINFYHENGELEDAVKAAKMADVDSNISEFKEGYETILGERGVTVSGGQKQRISIARALVKDAPILILDDSVSAVDTKTEETILKNLDELRQGKTTILIAHRVTTIQSMDRIAIIDEGHLVGFGTHAELLANNELYQNMVYLQRLEDEVRGDSNE